LFSTFFLLALSYLRRTARGRSGSTACLLGALACISLLVLTRVVYGVFLVTVPAALWLALRRMPEDIRRPATRSLIITYIVAAAVTLAVLGWTNWTRFDSPFSSGYEQWRPQDHTISNHPLDGAWGYLFSVRWSIFLYFPPLIVALPFWGRFFRQHRDAAVLLLATFFPMLLGLGAMPIWRGEWTYGPRYMIFALPLMALPALLAPTVLTSVKARRWALSATIVAIAGCLWLQFQVIRGEYFAFHRIIFPFEKSAPSMVTFRYINDHVEGVILGDLYRNRANLDRVELFELLAPNLSPDDMASYKRYVSGILAADNFYWLDRTLPPARRAPPPPPPPGH
jgi:hypothetical protein